MKNEITKLLKEIAELLELKGENPFKVRAYTNAAQVISDNNVNVEKRVKEGTIGEVKGLGKALQEKLTEFVQTGSLEYLENLREEIPEGLIEISRVQGVGPKKAQKLLEEFEINSAEDLLKLAKEGKVQNVKGFGSKSEQKIIEDIEEKKTYKGYIRLDQAHEIAELIMDRLKEISAIKKASISGEVRRSLEIISSIEFVIQYKDKNDLISKLKESFEASEKESNIFTSSTKKDIPIYFYIADEFEYGWLLNKTSSSSEYQDAFNHFVSNSYKVEENHILDSSGKVELQDDKALYEKLGFSYVPPEIREESQAVQFANNGYIPDLVEESDMKGMLHCHSTWSDGVNSIEEMALAAKELGYSYFAICDHSKTAGYANGLSVDRVKKQQEEIDKLNEKNLGIKIIKGIESDILPDGSLDYDEKILEMFDIVVASVHSNFNMSEKDMTERVTRALMSPYTTILGHPTGRLILRRKGYALDQDAIIEVAKDNNKIIEINANPHRLDLDWRYVIKAKQAGVKIAINPDAHNTKGLKHNYYGTKIARKGWLEKENVVNTYDFSRFKKEVINK